jgi:hypothetical protein
MDQNNEVKNKIVQTYAEDMAKVIEDSQGGVIKKIIRGQEESEALKRNLSPQSKKNKFFMLISFLLIFLAFATLSFFSFRTKINTVEPAKQFVSPIFNDANTFTEIKGLTKDQITQTVLNGVRATKVKNGGVEGIYLTEDKNNIVGLRKFITLIQSNFIPGDVAFVDDNFLMGVVNGETKDFFILLKVRSMIDVFDPLRAWENKMFSDLHGFFSIAISPETKYLLTASFQDGIIQNKNARILYGTDNKIIMMYILADDNSVIIADNENAAREIMLRLASSQIKK